MRSLGRITLITIKSISAKYRNRRIGTSFYIPNPNEGTGGISEREAIEVLIAISYSC